MIIGGYDVHFPFKPYASQIGIASRVLKALDTGTNALLESPTGSGKSLALLCAAMAWQERWKASREAADSRGDAHDAQRHDRRAEAEPADRASKPSGGGKKEKVPSVYYATRTHSQIAQVVRELKRTSYRPAMTVLGSREHYCVNQKARTAAKKGGKPGRGVQVSARIRRTPRARASGGASGGRRDRHRKRRSESLRRVRVQPRRFETRR